MVQLKLNESGQVIIRPSPYITQRIVWERFDKLLGSTENGVVLNAAKIIKLNFLNPVIFIYTLPAIHRIFY